MTKLHATDDDKRHICILQTSAFQLEDRLIYTYLSISIILVARKTINATKLLNSNDLTYLTIKSELEGTR